jgi:hypothetical protein
MRPDQAALIQGAGAIPNSTFPMATTSERLAVRTPFPVNRCVVSLITRAIHLRHHDATFIQSDWVKGSFGSLVEKTARRKTRGRSPRGSRVSS